MFKPKVGQIVRTKNAPLHYGKYTGKASIIRDGHKQVIGLIDLGMECGFWSQGKTTFISLLAVSMDNLMPVSQAVSEVQ